MLCREEAPDSLCAQRPLELRRLYVLPEHHGSRAAGDLLARAVHHAAADDHDCLWLGASKDNQRGLAFYRKHGFDIAGKFHFPLGSVVYEGFLLSRAISHQSG